MAEFELAIDATLENEGGLVDDPKDPGGVTKYGISQRAYPNLDIRGLTKDQAKAIYLKDYWRFNGIKDQAVAGKLFDAYVNEKHHAMEWAQQIVNVAVDGCYGPNTEMAINAMDPVKFIAYFRQWWVNHILQKAQTSPIVMQDERGLLKRARQ